MVENLFGTDGIRGLVNLEQMADEIAIMRLLEHREISPAIMKIIGESLGRMGTQESSQKMTVVVGWDDRPANMKLAESLTVGLNLAEFEVIHIGLCATPTLHLATLSNNAEFGCMITASHNPSDYNGFKIIRDNAKPISSKTGLKEIQRYAESDKRYLAEKKGQYKKLDLNKEYVAKILSFIDSSILKNLKIVLNPGNGGAGEIVDRITENLPFELIKVNYEADSSFPNGVPNPMIEENRISTSNAVIKNKADMGIAWDGDFDRCFFFDENGEFVEGYYLVGLLAKSFLIKQKNESIIFDPRLTWNTIDEIERHQGKAIQCQSGHSFSHIKMELVIQVKSIVGMKHLDTGEQRLTHYYYLQNKTTM